MAISKPERVLVTGGAGFIGSHIVDALLDRGIEVGVLDDYSTGEATNLVDRKDSPSNSRLKVFKGDICDEEFVRRAVQDYDAVIHEAALVSVTRSVEDPLRSSFVNVNGTLNVLSAVRDAGVQRLIYSSSSSVYGETPTLPKSEDMNTRPISPYAVSKLAAENYCRVFARVYGMETISLRYFNVYGPRQKHGQYSGVIPTFIRKVMNGESPTVFGDGTQTRDFTFVRDVVQANLLALETSSPDAVNGGVFNVGSGRIVSLNDLASLTTKLMGRPDLRPEYTPPRKGDIQQSYADITKARRVLGYNPRFTLEMGLREVIDWFAEKTPRGSAVIQSS